MIIPGETPPRLRHVLGCLRCGVTMSVRFSLSDGFVLSRREPASGCRELFENQDSVLETRKFE